MAESYIQRQRRQSEGAKRRRERSGDSRSSVEVQQESDQQRKFDKAVAAGVDPEVAARAFNVTREGTTDIVTIQSTSGVGVTARTRSGGQTTQAQEFFDRQDRTTTIGRDFAIPTDAQGRTRTDLLVEYRRNPAMADFGALRYAGPATPTSRTAIATGSPNFPVDFPVYGVPTPTPVRGRFGGGELRAFEAANNPFIPDFIETPARQFGAAFLEGIRRPSDIGPRARSGTGFEALGATSAALTPIVGLGAAPTVIGARLGISTYLGTTGAIVATGTGAVLAPTISSRLSIRGQDRELLDDPRFQIAFSEARQARKADMNWFGSFVESVPGFGPKISDLTGSGAQSRFVAEFERQAEILGLPEGSSRLAVREFEALQRGGGAGLVLSQIPGELLGRSTFIGANLITRPGVRAFVSTLPAGALEGALVYGVERESGRQQINLLPQLGDLGLLGSAAFGSATAATVSGFIVGNIALRRARGRVAEGLMYAVDPVEAFGDIGADIIGGPSSRIAPLTPINPNAFVGANVFDTGTTPTGGSTASRPTRGPAPVSTRDFVGGVPSASNVPVPSFTNTNLPARTSTRVRSPSTIDFIGTRSPVNVPIKSIVDTRPFVPVQSRTPVNVPLPVTPNNLVPTFTNTPVLPTSRTFPFTDTFTFINTRTTIPNITGWVIPPSGFLGGGGFGTGRPRRKRKTKNLPSLTAAIQKGFNADKAFRSIKGRSFSGIEIRGFV